MQVLSCVLILLAIVMPRAQSDMRWVTWSGRNASTVRTYMLSNAALIDIWETTPDAQWRIVEAPGATTVQISGPAVEGITSFTPILPCWRVTLESDDPSINETWEGDGLCYRSYLPMW